MSDSIRVLVVDDEPALCRALRIALGRGGFAVATATHGDEALALLRRERVDALVLDLRLPDLRGDAIFQLAVALQPHLRSATLFVTGDASERADLQVRACGVPCLRKPFELADVVGAVRAMTSRAARATA